ncbi:MAG: hypothetical protein RXR18_04985 [Nitrososphaeria archaeon]
MIIVKGENTFPRGKGWITPEIFLYKKYYIVNSQMGFACGT